MGCSSFGDEIFPVCDASHVMSLTHGVTVRALVFFKLLSLLSLFKKKVLGSRWG